MLFFRKKYSVVTTRSLNKKIKKIRKIRNNYIDFCNIITNEADSFTETMKHVHDQMIDAVKESKKVSEDFEEVYKKYSDEEDEIEEGSYEVDPDEIDDIFNELTGMSADDDEEDIEYEDECDCEDCVDENDEESEDNEEEDDEEEEEINVSEIEMKNFPKTSSPIIAATTYMLYDRLEKDGFKSSYESAALTVKSEDDKTFSMTGRGVNVTVGYDGADVTNVEISTQIPVIPHSDPCRKILADITIDGFLPIISGTKPISYSSGEIESKWYFLDIGEGFDMTDEDSCVLITNVEVNKKTRKVTLRYVYSDSIPTEEIKKMLRNSKNDSQK